MISQTESFIEKELTITKYVEGTLLLPNKNDHNSLAIIIGGSGPTDRNGNQNFLKNNSLKKLAEALSSKGIASFRYDKRVVKQIKLGIIDENILFDDFVEDAISTITYFRNKNIFKKIYVIGHSQGSLVGMIAAKNRANGFISLAGAGESIDNVIIEQINKTAPQFNGDTKRILQAIKKGKKVKDYPPALKSVFREDIQEFMKNWMSYEPTKIIKELEIPILIINGDKDLQTTVSEAIKLKEARPNSQIAIIKNMNHVLVPITGNDLDNSKSYNELNRKISEELIENIVKFINTN
ncbi:alpha/beta hydrolase [Hyunsoonleella aestuarii]|uniref:Alpha/beta hydrolase n=2 Tax=Hyunsoonleella aestuarii TaxID=912802 RepID=A0ABP8EBV0_9FLAO